uniref:Conserved plasma membrane protein n=1 Tax=Rhabditophanes sp. KR3021 TaxID=114890 RepID=A0AC35TUK2_9BILA
MAKVEVQIRRCCCCGLTPGTVFTALYTLLLFSILVGLGLWGLSDTTQNGDKSHFTSCELEAMGKIRAENRKLVFHEGTTTVIVEDTTSYHCGLGLYAEEMKFEKETRYTLLLVNVFLWVALIIASILCLIGLAIYNEWLLLPWIGLMVIEVIRGLISTFFIFWLSYGNLARLTVGITALAFQFFHISLLLVMFAKFQRMHNRNIGALVDVDKLQYHPESNHVYPVNTMISGPQPGQVYNGYSPNHYHGDPYAVQEQHINYGHPQQQYYPRY